MKIHNALVRKSNVLIETSYRLLPVEQKLILILASQIKRGDQGFKPYKIKISDFIKITGNVHHDYAAIEKVIVELKSKNLRIVLKEKDETTIINTSWLVSSKYIEGSSMIELCFAPTLKPLLLNLNKCFTSFKLKNVLFLKGHFSIHIYELLKQYEAIGSRVIGLARLKSLIGINDNEYKLYGHFKIRVLMKAQAELKAKTDICFEFEEIKEGRKVSKINFIITKNTDVINLIDISPLHDISEDKEDISINQLLDLVPHEYRAQVSIKKTLQTFLNQQGYDYVARNISYTNAKSNALHPETGKKKSNYRGYLKKSLQNDFGLDYQEDQIIQKEKEKLQREKQILKEKLETEKNKKLAAEIAGRKLIEEQKELAKKHIELLSSEQLQTLENEAINTMEETVKNIVIHKKTGWKTNLQLKMNEVIRKRLFSE